MLPSFRPTGTPQPTSENQWELVRKLVRKYVTDTRENDYTCPSDAFLLGVIIFDAEVGISR